MTGPLASIAALANRSIDRSALVADGAERGLARGLGRLAQSVDQRLDRARPGVAGDVELGELLAAGFPGRIGRGPGAVCDPGADPAEDALLDAGPGEQSGNHRAERKPAAERQQRRLAKAFAGAASGNRGALAGRIIGIDRPLAERRGGGGL